MDIETENQASSEVVAPVAAELGCAKAATEQSLSAAPAARYLESVHLLRGIAAFLVVIDHSFGMFPLPLLNPLLDVVDGHGELGVVVFFVISGFVLPLSLDGHYSTRHFPKFVAKRLIRIEPTYVVSLVFAAAILFFKTRMAPNGEPWIPSLGQLAAHLLYVVPYTGYTWLNEVYWTLAIEFQYYLLIGLLFPAFRWASRRSTLLMGCCVTIFASLAFLAPLAPQIGILKQTPYFAMGLLVFDLLRNPQRLRFSLALGIGLIGFGVWQGLNPLHLAAALSCGLLIVFWKPACWSWRWLGSISYSLYVIHYPLTIFVNQSARHFITGSLEWLLYFVPFIAILVSLGAGWLLYKFVEEPTQKLSKVVRYRS